LRKIAGFVPQPDIVSSNKDKEKEGDEDEDENVENEIR
jgi:hypothetical protein